MDPDTLDPQALSDQNARKVQWYGWHPSKPDMRDQYLQVAKPSILPATFSLRAGFALDPFDQGQLGSCGPNSLASMIIFDQERQNLPIVMPSRLFSYYVTRVLEGTVNQDSGVENRDMFKAYNKRGVCSEAELPYVTDDFAIKPPKADYTDALNHRPIKYARVPQTLTAMKQAIFAGYPILFGFSVYASFESDEVAQSGVVPMPAPNEEQVGGHDTVIDSWDDTTQRFGVRNSWGTDWGQSGYFTIPYAYATNPDLAGDFWTLTSVR